MSESIRPHSGGGAGLILVFRNIAEILHFVARLAGAVA